MNRNLVINVLLILAGIVLAFALFGAGVLWKSRTAKTSRQITETVGSIFLQGESRPTTRADVISVASPASPSHYPNY